MEPFYQAIRLRVCSTSALVCRSFLGRTPNRRGQRLQFRSRVLGCARLRLESRWRLQGQLNLGQFGSHLASLVGKNQVRKLLQLLCLVFGRLKHRVSGRGLRGQHTLVLKVPSSYWPGLNSNFVAERFDATVELVGCLCALVPPLQL